MSVKLALRAVLLSLGLGLLVGLAACGGDSAAPAEPGRVQLTIAWPAADSRYIPSYAESLVFELVLEEGLALPHTLTVDRPDDAPVTQTVAFDQLLPPGTYRLTGQAKSEAEGEGAVVAQAVTTVEVEAGATANVALVLQSAIDRIEVLGQPLSLPAGNSLQLSARALDAQANVVFVPAALLTWERVSGDAGTITAQGLFTAGATGGTVRVRVSETGANKSAEADITVTTPSTGGLAATAWPKPHGDAGNRGRGTGNGAAGASRWAFDSGATGPVFAGAALGPDGTVFVGDDSGKVRALNGATGAPVWTFDGADNAGCTGVVLAADGTLYVGIGVRIYALNSTNGEVVWQHNIANFEFVQNDLAVGPDGTVYAAVGQQPSRVIALDGLTGDLRGEHVTEANDIIGTGFAVDAAGNLYFGASDFTPTQADPPAATPDGRFHSLTPSLQRRWTRPVAVGPDTSSAFIGDPSLSDDEATVYAPNQDGRVRALDAATGDVRWTSDVLTADEGSSASVGADGRLYVGTRLNGLVALDAATGAQVWSAPTNGGVQTSPVLSDDGVVYVGDGSLEGGFRAIDAGSGAELWLLPLNTRFSAPPALGADGTIYVGGWDGKLHAIN